MKNGRFGNSGDLCTALHQMYVLDICLIDSDLLSPAINALAVFMQKQRESLQLFYLA